ncbi:GH25 family lysozyme [Acutalibacter caecimuris]|uniref:GH25 family lysozyme n=1 Tax=Acutalibacter caecimuris TaxID=3093657 RepID=UPI002AC963E3|nr:GH25 family lysozyme [Acutalibacter sp. M00118]
MAGYLASGIDISQFNGDVDINGLRGKVDFIIIRCGYGSDYTSQDDTQYWANVRKCRAAGIPFGVYLYSYARNREMALSEARHTLRLLQGVEPLYGVWYDLEDATLPSGQALVDNCLAYYGALKDAGFYCGLYASLSWMRTRLDSPRLAGIDRWVAQWNDQLDYPGAGLWQYSDRGVINGKIFDLDRAFRDYPAIIGKGDWTDMTREEVQQLARQEAQAVYDRNEKKYPTFDQVPKWARQAVEDVYRELGLAGSGETVTGKTRIDASYSYIRALYVIERVLQKLDGMAES